MSKTITIDWKGGSRRIELENPGRMKRLHQFAIAPNPIAMNPGCLAWVNSTLVMGSELEIDTVESMQMSVGFGLLSEIIDYWSELKESEETEDNDVKDLRDSDKVADESEPEFEGIELDDQGAVDVEDMR